MNQQNKKNQIKIIDMLLAVCVLVDVVLVVVVVLLEMTTLMVMELTMLVVLVVVVVCTKQIFQFKSCNKNKIISVFGDFHNNWA
jgi:hypothetical protein